MTQKEDKKDTKLDKELDKLLKDDGNIVGEKGTEEQLKSRTEHLRPWQWKKGQSGNPGGRKPGQSMKEYARTFLSKMTEEERQDFLNGLSKDIVWKMAEGNPEQEVRAGITISDLMNKLKNNANKGTTRDGGGIDGQELEDESSLQDSGQGTKEDNIQKE